MTDPIAVLKHEHRIILAVCDAADRESQRLSSGGAVDAERVERMLDFIRTFADRCHHAKEEDLLFVRMGERGFPTEAGPVRVMLQEHELGRAHVRATAEALPRAAAGDAAATRVVAENLAGWAALLRSHIAKEDNILYPMAEQALTPEDMAELAESFERVEHDEMGAGVHERYAALARELTAA
jgi:hemerythrin-like domain-containing protein